MRGRRTGGVSSKEATKLTNIDVQATNDQSVVKIIGASFTAADERVILVDDDAAGKEVTITLPLATGISARYDIKKVGDTADVVVKAAGSKTIDGGLTATLTLQHECITVVSDKFNWFIV